MLTVDEEEKELLVNPNCGFRIIYDYIKLKTNVPEDEEIDLCDNKGNLKFLAQMTPWGNATEVLPCRTTLYLIRFETTEDNRRASYPAIPQNHPLYEELKTKLNRHNGDCINGTKRSKRKVFSRSNTKSQL